VIWELSLQSVELGVIEKINFRNWPFKGKFFFSPLVLAANYPDFCGPIWALSESIN
jgi:hypothetical protein